MGSVNPKNPSQQDLNDSGYVQDASMGENCYRGQVELLDLSDDVLLYILKYCAPRDLKALGHTCPRLGALICDRTLWTRVDARSSPIGQERLRWLLDHCLSPATTELKLAGYANKHSRCLGIQDLQVPVEAGAGVHRVLEAAAPTQENFLLRMWYPHLPRCAVTPRWPDKAEAESKAPTNEPTTSKTDSNSNSSGERKIPERFSKEFEDIRDACKGPQFTLTGHLMRDLKNKCSNLTSLSLENCNIDYKTTRIRQFPPNLKQLSLRGTRCYNLPLNTSYLGKIQECLPWLEILDVSDCDWFEPASLMPLSKLPCLRKLYMRECRRLTECVAYASLAARYGFKELRVIDVRRSPLADSEISALGWLPLLEELYCAPPEDFHSSSDHTHSWNDTRASFSELEHWEKEEPDYYKITSPEPAPLEDEEPPAEPTACVGEMLLGSIIVIQPNANRQPEAIVRPAGPLGPFLAEHLWAPAAEPVRPPAAEQQRPPIRQFVVCTERSAAPKEPSVAPTEPPTVPTGAPKLPIGPSAAPTGPTGPAAPKEPPTESPGPSTVPIVPAASSGVKPGPSKRPSNDENQDSPKRPRFPTRTGLSAEQSNMITSAFDELTEAVFDECRLNEPGALQRLRRHHHSIRIPINPRAVPPNPPVAPRTPEAPAGPSSPKSNSSADPSTPPADNSGPSASVGSPADASVQPGPSKRPSNGENTETPKKSRLKQKMPPLVDFAEAVLARCNFNANGEIVGHLRPNTGQGFGIRPIPFVVPDDGLNCPRLRNRRQSIPVPVNAGASTSRNDPQRPRAVPLRINATATLPPIMHIDVDIQRQSNTYMENHIGYHLISDSAILRFGRADNDNVNYVHIGRNALPEGMGTASRPDRSNLRILSIAGYTNITDRSLEHLATAAPNLMRLDFSYTNVTARGVEVFKAIRPNCEVTFSEFGKINDDKDV